MLTPPSKQSKPDESTNEPGVLANFASVVGLLGASLYFTGWIYRWTYYGFFQLEVTTLDLPVESFLLVPIQVLFGNWEARLKTLIAFITAVICIHLTLWIFSSLFDEDNQIAKQLNNFKKWIINQSKRRKLPLAKLFTSLANFSSEQFNAVKFLQSLLDETVIVAWVLIILFNLASHRGVADARRDAVNQTSTLPVVTFIAPENRIAYGRNLKKLTQIPPVEGYKIIGDKVLFDNLEGFEINDTRNAQNSRVWRLLTERGGWIYLFRTLASNSDAEDRPLVLAIQEGDFGDKLMILSSETSPE